MVPYILTENALNFVVGGRPYSVPRDFPEFQDVLTHVLNGDASAAVSVLEAMLRRVSGAIEICEYMQIRAGVVLYRGEPLANSLTERIIQMQAEGFDVMPLARFMDKLMSNPMRHAAEHSHTAALRWGRLRDDLYRFIEIGQMPLTADGDFLAYKKVRSDYLDIHSGTMRNAVGDTLRIPYAAVDDNPDQTCSSGLHVCSAAYLPHFGACTPDQARVVICKVSPADVVSIPSDYNDSKMRVCAYVVVDEYVGWFDEHAPAWQTSVVSLDDTNEDEDEEPPRYSVEYQNAGGDWNTYVECAEYSEALATAVRCVQRPMGKVRIVDANNPDAPILIDDDFVRKYVGTPAD